MVNAAIPAAKLLISYGEGKLVAYSTTLDVDQIETALANFGWSSSAVANWHNAPYGQATKEFVQTVQGTDDGAQYNSTNASWEINNGFNPAKFTANYTNIGTTLSVGVYVDVKDIGFVSLGQVIIPNPSYPTEAYVEIPSDNDPDLPGMYRPIYQDACVLLQVPGDLTSVNPDALAFYEWVQTPDAKAIIRAWGYNTDIPTNASVILKASRK
ncbi:MAG: hypothetical protein LBT86_02750 [Deltaproteobacteria bacterium]|nr:hypothetical protein [Deltaproteobacteria bacterium]